MSWSQSIARGCERALGAGFWSEPVNLASALSYVIAAFLALYFLRCQPPFRRDADHYFLIALLCAIGVGAALLHIFAQRWSEVIFLALLGLFTLVFTAFALNRFLGWPPGVTFMATAVLSLLGLVMLGAGKLNSSALVHTRLVLALVPFLVIVLALGWQLKRWGQRSAGGLFLAGGLLFMALIFLAGDGAACSLLTFSNIKIGSHFLWHLASAGSFFVLLRAAIRHGDPAPQLEILPPERKSR